MSYGVEGEFDLVVEAPKNSASESIDRLVRILSSQCGFKIIEVPDLLDRGPLIVKRASSAAELNGLSKALSEAGATVSIVRRASKRTGDFSAAQSQLFQNFCAKYLDGLQRVLASIDIGEIESFVGDLLKARETRKQIFFLGNGGSAASASHFANDFSKVRFEDERLLFRVMSLTDNVSWMSAIGNDFGYDYVFEHQLKNLLLPGDVVIAISSSGNSANIIRAVEYANSKGAVTYGIVGFDGGKLREAAQRIIYIPTKKGQYGFMEDATLVIGHIASIYLFEHDRAQRH